MLDVPVFFLAAMAGLACLLSLALTPLFRKLARRVGLVDSPDGRRKLQSTAVPKAGGLAVLVATLLVLGLAISFRPGLAEFLVGDDRFWSLVAAATFIGLVGLVDDFRGLRGRYKVLGQLVAISMLVFPGGLYIGSVSLFGSEVHLGVFGLAFTFFWMLGCINALNLIDGMDGLLGVVAIIACITLGVVGALSGKWLVAVVAMTLAGSLVGFLAFNLPPARVYLGDCGSMVIGLIIGAIGIESSMKGATAAALIAPAALLIIPILDTLAACVRRGLTGRSVFTTDRGHLHHCLLRRGMSRGGVLVLVGALSLVAAAGGVLSYVFKADAFALAGAGIVAAGLLFTRRFGTAEARLVLERGQSVWATLRHGRAVHKSYNVEMHLQGTASWKDIWLGMTDAADEMRIHALRLDVNLPVIHEGYHAKWHRLGSTLAADRNWRTELPLFLDGHVIGRLVAVGSPTGSSIPDTLARLSGLVEEAQQVAARLTAEHSSHVDHAQAGRASRTSDFVRRLSEPCLQGS